MKLTTGSRITDVLTQGFILTVTPESGTTVSVEARQAGGPLTKRNVSTATSFGPYDADIEYAVNLLSGSAAEVAESQSSFSLNQITKTVVLTEAEYAALAVKDPTTEYLVVAN